MKWISILLFVFLLPMPAIAGVQMFFNGSEFRLNTNRANVIVQPRCINGRCGRPSVNVNVYPRGGYYYAPYYGRPYYAPPVILYRR